MITNVNVKISVRTGEAVNVDLVFENRGNSPVYLNPDGWWGRVVGMHIFTIQIKNEKISYTGPSHKMTALSKEHFVKLEPGSALKKPIRIDHLYDFRPGKNTYTIEYRSFHGDADLPGGNWKAQSTPVSFAYSRR